MREKRVWKQKSTGDEVSNQDHTCVDRVSNLAEARHTSFGEWIGLFSQGVWAIAWDNNGQSLGQIWEVELRHALLCEGEYCWSPDPKLGHVAEANLRRSRVTN